MRAFIGGFVAALVMGAIVGLVLIYSGGYDVAASAGHPAFMGWILSTASDRSIASHATGLKAPAVSDPGTIQLGLREYHEECQRCHGGPGVDPRRFAKGLDPDAPDLGESANELSAAELFWTMKHGIEFTGMPAFGATHPDSVLWAITAFVKRLPQTSPAEYGRLVREAERGQAVERDNGRPEPAPAPASSGAGSS